MITCNDLGSDKCPCGLAETGDCIYCSRLNSRKSIQKQSGEMSICDCNWRGVCVYTEYKQNGRQILSGMKSKLCNIKSIRQYSDDFKILTISVDKGFAIKALRAGSYVFISSKNKVGNLKYEFPISVMKSNPEKEEIQVGLYRCGVKSKTLFEEREAVTVRGIYNNGIVGIRHLERALMGIGKTRKKVCIFAKGLALAPLANISDILKNHRDYEIYIDLDKVGDDFLKDNLGELDVAKIKIVNFNKDLNELLERARANEKRKSDFINLIFASPYYINKFREASPEIVYSNSANMCCGEGICGACTDVDEEGNVHRMCKETF